MRTFSIQLTKAQFFFLWGAVERSRSDDAELDGDYLAMMESLHEALLAHTVSSRESYE